MLKIKSQLQLYSTKEENYTKYYLQRGLIFVRFHSKAIGANVKTLSWVPQRLGSSKWVTNMHQTHSRYARGSVLTSN